MHKDGHAILNDSTLALFISININDKIMKKFFYLFVLAFLPMCFIACGGDDSDGNSNSSTIKGKWGLAARQMLWIDTDPVRYGGEPREVYNNISNISRENNPTVYIELEFGDNSYYHYTDFSWREIDRDDTGTYSINGNTLTVSHFDGVSMSFEIEKNTPDSLVLFLQTKNSKAWTRYSFGRIKSNNPEVNNE